ncbi:MAG TPA: YfhO family protein, partial [Thermodesulfovibrionales bacterium]|nr:YfhO family protein [Thermodesulfovibrionales bacterium]
GPYGFSGHKPAMPFSFDIAGNAWVNEPNPYIIRNITDTGSLPAWNPYEGLGTPLIANLNTEVFNPLKIPLNIYPTPFSQDMFFLLRLFVMGLFTYLFLRELKLCATASFLGATFFMLSGYSIWWINLHPLSTIMYLPGSFYFYERWRTKGRRSSLFLMSLFLCLALAAGKMPDVIMGLSLLFVYALWKGLREGSMRGMFKEGALVVLISVSGALMAAVVLFPFLELYSHASPLAKAMRTGAASHTIPLISSVSLFQPLFLGWPNYCYGSWLHWEPAVVMPHSAVVILLLFLYAMLSGSIVKKTFPFLLFSMFIFAMVYGILPSHIVSRIPILGSVEFLKYNAMLYFSLAIMSATAFDQLLSGKIDKKKFYLSAILASSLICAYFLFLHGRSFSAIKGHLIVVLLLTLLEIALLAVAFYFSKKKTMFGGLVLLFLVAELYLYMPTDHPVRHNPYEEPPYAAAVAGSGHYRITGAGNCVPPLTSNAVGLYDIRDISVLLPGDYYLFSENLVSFSMPQTNNPNPLVSATSPFIDILGVKYILSQGPLNRWSLEEAINSQVASLRWIRLFDSMISHTVKGGATYAYFNQNGDERFTFSFPMDFVLDIKLRISEPFIFSGIALKDVPKGTTSKVKLMVDGRVTEIAISDGRWNDQWIDVSQYLGKVVAVRIESGGSGEGRVLLGNFGLSPGEKAEKELYVELLALHRRELNRLAYRGDYGGISVYENKNVMDRAFVLHHVKTADNLDAVIHELRAGTDFRDVGIVSDLTPGMARGLRQLSSLTSRGVPTTIGDRVTINRYDADEISIVAESQGGLLVLSDLYYPGWKAQVNGKAEEIVKVFGVLRGVPIQSGKSKVLFTYRPKSFYAGIIITAMTFVGWLVYLYSRRRKSDRSCR